MVQIAVIVLGDDSEVEVEVDSGLKIVGCVGRSLVYIL